MTPMTRLTVRSGQDGRVLARIVQHNGQVFVVDWGDPVWIRDAAQRTASGGFRVQWAGEDEVAAAGSPSMMRLLAHHYAAQGLLVFVDEPHAARSAGPAEPVIDPLADTTEFTTPSGRARHLGRPQSVPLFRSEEELTTQRGPGEPA